MARNQTFSVSLSLLTKNFQKGVKTVQTSLNNLKMQFRNFAAAFGAGLGITEVLRNMIDSAKQLDKAQTVLKNVSTGLDGYGKNQKFVMELSKKYNQEMTVLMNNYAKFHSAANMANMSMEQQTHIYEALTRAGTYYSLTADEMNGVMLAVNQMISKGKVSSEELRRQLGERLPGAMNLAAKAMGVTTAELDKMIRDGKVMATDLLPLLADELNNVTQNVDTNHIQGALARMKNAFTDLTSKLNVGDLYKKIINGVADGMEYLSNNISSIKQKIISTFAAILGGTFFNKMKANFNAYVAELEVSLNRANSLLMAHKSQLTGLASKGLITIDFDDKNFITGINNIGNLTKEEFEKAEKHVAQYNAHLRRSIELQGQSKTALGWMASGFKKVGKAIKSMMSAFAPMIIIYAITTIIQKISAWYREQQRIKNIVKDTREEYEELAKKLGADDVELQALKESLPTASDEKKLKIINRINQLLGLQGDKMFDLNSSNEDINSAIEERLKLLEEERKYQAARQTVQDKKNIISQKESEIAGLQQEIDETKSGKNLTGSFAVDVWDALGLWRAGGPNTNQKESQIRSKQNEIAELTRAIEKLEPIITEGGMGAVKRQSIISNEGYDPNGDGSKTAAEQLAEDYAKIQEEYNNSLRALNDKKKDGLITEDEYNEALESLYKSTLDSVYALNDIDENTNRFASSLRDNYLALLANKKKEDKVQDALDEYHKNVQEIENQYSAGVITQKELEDALFDLLDEVVKNVSSMGELSGAAKDLADKYKKQKKEKTLKDLSDIKAPEKGTLNTMFDYKKDASEIYQGNAEFIRDYATELQGYIEELKEYQDVLSGDELTNLTNNITQLEGELGKLTQTAESFEQAAQFAEIQEDIKNLKGELANGILDNITNIATAAERLTNSWKNVIDTMSDADASGWEKFLTVFTTIISTIETLVSVYQTLQTAVSAYKALQLAMAGAEQAGLTMEVEKLAILKAQAVAEKDIAMAQGIASAAAKPYPENLAAIASTAAAIVAAFAMVPKFADGGIVQGSSTIGDHNIARVNAGEMILNKQQQATLFGMLNGSNSGVIGKNSNVEFKIRGSELVGVLNNYGKKISK